MVIARLAATLVFLAAVPAAHGQTAPFNRLSPDVFEVTPPTDRVSGAPGEMAVRQRACRLLPMTDIRRRIVDVAVQEWGYFGFPIRDGTSLDDRDVPQRPAPGVGDPLEAPFARRFSRRLSPEESARVATSVAGYWAVTPQATMMISRQNGSWNGSGTPGRADPWSAAFISWVMCEAGLGGDSRFQRAIAHHVYIDQAIRARDGGAPQAAFVAYDTGEAPIAPGDLLCAARRPVYRTLAERRRQMGGGARTHCDVVVKVDEQDRRIFAVGGNVGRAVSLKVLPAVQSRSGHLHAGAIDEGRPVFAHLKLRAEPIELHALDNSPTVKALACAAGGQALARVGSVLPKAASPQRC
jgi:hypothetical protein